MKRKELTFRSMKNQLLWIHHLAISTSIQIRKKIRLSTQKLQKQRKQNRIKVWRIKNLFLTKKCHQLKKKIQLLTIILFTLLERLFKRKDLTRFLQLDLLHLLLKRSSSQRSFEMRQNRNEMIVFSERRQRNLKKEMMMNEEDDSMSKI